MPEVEVHNQHLLAHLRQICTEVNGGGGLADTAFLVDESVDASHVIYGYGVKVSGLWQSNSNDWSPFGDS